MNAGTTHHVRWARRFGGWLKALSNAGLKKSRNLGVTRDDYFENLEKVWRHLGPSQDTGRCASHYQITVVVLTKMSSGHGEGRSKHSWSLGNGRKCLRIKSRKTTTSTNSQLLTQVRGFDHKISDFGASGRT